tara:strand:+ start:320 stop:574 length:255 start_codon:yes stop_codon:yes gene_type:complete
MSWLITIALSPLWIFTAFETDACMDVKIRDKSVALCDWQASDYKRTFCRDCGSIDYILLKEVKGENYVKKLARNRYHRKRILRR